MAEEEVKKEVKVVAHHPADTNGDGKVSEAEEAMYLEFKRKELEDADAMRDAQRKMTWFALAGLLLYPLAVVLASMSGLTEAQKTLGSMAPTYLLQLLVLLLHFLALKHIVKKESK